MGKPVGFIGEHLEGSMGLLEILPGYRGKGYGTELESFMICHMLEKGQRPFARLKRITAIPCVFSGNWGLRSRRNVCIGWNKFFEEK